MSTLLVLAAVFVFSATAFPGHSIDSELVAQDAHDVADGSLRNLVLHNHSRLGYVRQAEDDHSGVRARMSREGLKRHSGTGGCRPMSMSMSVSM